MAWSVLFVIDRRQTSVTFDTEDDAEKFRILVNTVGARRAMDAWGISDTPKAVASGPTLAAWCRAHIAQLTGVSRKCLDDYERYIRLDIEPWFGELPLARVVESDIAGWVQHLEERGNAPKTIKNKHGFLSAALARAVPQHLPANPAAGRRLPRGRGDDHEMRMLTRAEFDLLVESTTEYWRPLMRFLVASGCRWGEAVALRPDDVDVDSGVVRIRRAWTYSSEGYQLGPPKTKRSRRDIVVPVDVLSDLDYSGEWLFVNREGGPVRYAGFRHRVWDAATARAGIEPAPTPHDLRHTCASWMLTAGVPITVVSRHLGHESIQITVDTYGDVDQSGAQIAAAAMSKLLLSNDCRGGDTKGES